MTLNAAQPASLVEVRYIHRRNGENDIYFVASRGERPGSIRAGFRISGKIPELWDPDGIRIAATDLDQ